MFSVRYAYGLNDVTVMAKVISTHRGLGVALLGSALRQGVQGDCNCLQVCQAAAAAAAAVAAAVAAAAAATRSELPAIITVSLAIADILMNVLGERKQECRGTLVLLTAGVYCLTGFHYPSASMRRRHTLHTLRAHACSS